MDEELVSESDDIQAVTVILKLKPQKDHDSVISSLGNKSIKISNPILGTSANGEITSITKNIEYGFDWVLGDSCTQEDTFKRSCPPLLKQFFGGSNSLLFCYGPSGSGKTYTIQGEPNNPGLLFNILNSIFNSIEKIKNGESISETPSKIKNFGMNFLNLFLK